MSLLVMVRTLELWKPSVAPPVGLASWRSTVSLVSVMESANTGMTNVLVVSPSANASVPAVAM